MIEKAMDRFKLMKRLTFTFAAFVVAVFIIESGARIIEHFIPPEPVDARSPLAFQTLPSGTPISGARIEGKDQYHLLWPERIGQTLPVQKGDDEIRIVLVGGSQAVGLGVAPPAAFAAWIERLLNESGGKRRVRVVNLAKTGYASPQLTYLLEKYIGVIKPDLILTVMGNNEFLDSSLAINPNKQAPLTFARKIERHFAVARLLRPVQKQAAAAEVNFVAPSTKTPAMIEFAEKRLGRSLQRMAHLAKNAGARFMICTVPVNLRYIHSRQWFFAGDGPDQHYLFKDARWALRYGAPQMAAHAMEKILKDDPVNPAAKLIYAKALLQLGNSGATDAYAKLIVELDSEQTPRTFENIYMSALAHYDVSGPDACRGMLPVWMKQLNLSENGGEPHALAQLAELYYLSDYDGQKARQLALGSIELTGRQNRAGARINAVLQSEARRLGVLSYDLEKSVADRSPQRMPDYEIFLDYCHYNVRGHILVGHLLAQRIAEAFNLPKPPDAGPALKTEAELRRNRVTDIPDLRWWAGADFWVSRLTDEFAGQEEHFRRRIEEYMVQNGESALAYVYLGNWIAAAPMNSDEIRHGAAAQYYKALTLDFEMKAARSNLEYLKKMR